MPVHRFYCPQITASSVELDAEQTAHARKSLRLKSGDAVELFDGAGTLASGRIAALGRTMHVTITDRRTVARLLAGVTIAAATPKGARADAMVDMLTQLGVDRLIPLITDRSVVEPGAGKQQRFDRIALEAVKQSGRAYLMRIDPPTKLADVLADADHDCKLIAAPGDESAPPTFSTASGILVLIGPEGGWTDAEFRAAAEAGFLPVSLGPHIMRIETAALAAAALIRATSAQGARP